MKEDKSKTPPCPFNGIICFGGEDWWNHNRGHYDMQMMRELSSMVPVLYVNSIGMRLPALKEGAVLLKRLARKISSLRRGVVTIRDGFTVLSPLTVPGLLEKAVSHSVLPAQVRRAAQRLGISKPLAWVACPPAVNLLNKLNPVGLVYQRTDRFEEYPNVDSTTIKDYDSRLKAEADLTLYCSGLLFDEEASYCRSPLFVDHGVDYEVFAEAGRSTGEEPGDVRHLPHPRIVYVGNLESHRVDPKLILDVASNLPNYRFLLVGPSALPEGWCMLPNVTLLGQRPYEEVPKYMAAADVLIMPWQQNEWIKACNPVKLKEYLAVGRTVVTTPFDELRRYEGLVRIATDANSFAEAIRSAVTSPDDPERLRNRVREETWAAKCGTVLEELSAMGLRPESRSGHT